MEGAGFSMFQGAGSIHLNHSVQDRLEEEEQLADEKRRQQELQKKLETAFDDLADDDDADGSVNNSTHFTSINVSKHPTEKENKGEVLRNLASELADNGLYNYGTEEAPRLVVNGHNHQYVTHQDNHAHNGYVQNDMMEAEKLKMMYEMRVKECQQLAERMTSMESRFSAETNSLRARLELAITERERAELSLQQAQHALANSKHTILELEDRCSEMSQRLDSKERDLNELKLEMHATAESLREAQRRLQSQHNRVYDTDVLFREQTERHREEVDRLHQDLEKTRERLAEKENEVKKLENRCHESEKSKEELVVEKTEHINKLMSELQIAQSGVRNKEKYAQIVAERNIAREQIKEFGNKLDQTVRDLVMARDELKQWHQLLNFDSCNTLSNASPSNKIASLKNQLMQFKQLKQQIGSLSSELAKRDEKIETLKKSEHILKSKIEDLQSVEVHLNSKLAIMQNKLDLLSGVGDSDERMTEENDRLRNDVDELTRRLKDTEIKLAETEIDLDKLKSEQKNKRSIEMEANAALRNELETLTTKHKQVVEENTQLKVLYLQVCKTKDSLNRENSEMQEKLNALNEDLNRIGSKFDEAEYEALKRSNIELKEKLEAKSIQLEEVSNSKELLEKDKDVCEEHKKTIGALTAQIKELNFQLEVQRENESIIRELRNKAETFEHYIIERYRTMQTRSDKQTNTERSCRRLTCQDEADKSVLICQNSDVREEIVNVDSGGGGDNSSSPMEKEAHIRQEIAAQFAMQLKTIENRHHEKISIIEKQHSLNMNSLKELLEKKCNEVDTLRNLILAEREKVGEMMKLRAQQMEALIEDNKKLRAETQELREKFVLYGELRNQLERCQNKIIKLKNELHSKDSQHQHERDDTSRAVKELVQKMNENEAKTQKLEQELDELKEKYRNAKKLVHGLKEYASEKDKHTNSELKRIEAQYESQLARLQNKLQSALTSREQQVSDKLSKIESEFDAKLTQLKEKR